jgi:hypothetical protein
MAHGGPYVTPNPWTWMSRDYVGLAIGVSITWDSTTRLLTNCTVWRDDGCQYNNLLIGVPATAQVKTLPAPADGIADVLYTAIQMLRQGLTTIDDVEALQITASP